uniref:DUF8207 domain-containing protein n=1 Tax=Glossina austeni TaxID=7395 RepID=A0A1A9VMD1_GLOAU
MALLNSLSHYSHLNIWMDIFLLNARPMYISILKLYMWIITIIVSTQAASASTFGSLTRLINVYFFNISLKAVRVRLEKDYVGSLVVKLLINMLSLRSAASYIHTSKTPSTNVVPNIEDPQHVNYVGNQEEGEADFHNAEDDMNIDETSLESSSSSGSTPLLNNNINNNNNNKKRFRIKKSLKRNIDKKGVKVGKSLKGLRHLKREKKANVVQRRKVTTTTTPSLPTPIRIEQKKNLKRKDATSLDGFDVNNEKRLKTSHISFNQKRKSKSRLNTDKKRNKYMNNSNDSNKSALYSVIQTLINNEKLDKIYGFNVDVAGNWRYGNNKLKLNRDNTINIGNIKWTMTPGLFQVMFHSKPQHYTKRDLIKYKDILYIMHIQMHTNVIINQVRKLKIQKHLNINV